ncbi:hypothetical protein WN51_01273 [Melipona quadrifasciata]|uniref:Uncharacterized protein n=1 Tax=Melipona quadrifasciata TaxID=166423 RepID=A0A0N0U4J6_9HYME|nr:hypothetical protein WN51_01273 [Melipona quadrifasciata]
MQTFESIEDKLQIAQYQTTPLLLNVYPTPSRESRDPNQPITAHSYLQEDEGAEFNVTLNWPVCRHVSDVLLQLLQYLWIVEIFETIHNREELKSSSDIFMSNSRRRNFKLDCGCSCIYGRCIRDETFTMHTLSENVEKWSLGERLFRQRNVATLYFICPVQFPINLFTNAPNLQNAHLLLDNKTDLIATTTVITKVATTFELSNHGRLRYNELGRYWLPSNNGPPWLLGNNFLKSSCEMVELTCEILDPTCVRSRPFESTVLVPEGIHESIRNLGSDTIRNSWLQRVKVQSYDNEKLYLDLQISSVNGQNDVSLWEFIFVLLYNKARNYKYNILCVMVDSILKTEPSAGNWFDTQLEQNRQLQREKWNKYFYTRHLVLKDVIRRSFPLLSGHGRFPGQRRFTEAFPRAFRSAHDNFQYNFGASLNSGSAAAVSGMDWLRRGSIDGHFDIWPDQIILSNEGQTESTNEIKQKSQDKNISDNKILAVFEQRFVFRSLLPLCGIDGEFPCYNTHGLDAGTLGKSLWVLSALSRPASPFENPGHLAELCSKQTKMRFDSLTNMNYKECAVRRLHLLRCCMETHRSSLLVEQPYNTIQLQTSVCNRDSIYRRYIYIRTYRNSSELFADSSYVRYTPYGMQILGERIRIERVPERLGQGGVDAGTQLATNVAIIVQVYASTATSSRSELRHGSMSKDN